MGWDYGRSKEQGRVQQIIHNRREVFAQEKMFHHDERDVTLYLNFERYREPHQVQVQGSFFFRLS